MISRIPGINKIVLVLTHSPPIPLVIHACYLYSRIRTCFVRPLLFLHPCQCMRAVSVNASVAWHSGERVWGRMWKQCDNGDRCCCSQCLPSICTHSSSGTKGRIRDLLALVIWAPVLIPTRASHPCHVTSSLTSSLPPLHPSPPDVVQINVKCAPTVWCAPACSYRFSHTCIVSFLHVVLHNCAFPSKWKPISKIKVKTYLGNGTQNRELEGR
jgi:hypothetical protein